MEGKVVKWSLQFCQWGWSLVEVNKLTEAEVESEWVYIKRSYKSSWKLVDLDLFCVALPQERLFSLSHLNCCWSALFIWSRTDLLHWLCDDFVWGIRFLRYISKWFDTEDVAQRWKQKYQEVCNALDMVGFQEQVSSGIALFISEFSISLPNHLNLLCFM